MSDNDIHHDLLMGLKQEYQATRDKLAAATRDLATALRRVKKLEEDGRRQNEEWNARLQEALSRAAPGDILAELHTPDPNRGVSPGEQGLRSELDRLTQGYESSDVLWALCWSLRDLVKKNFGEALVIRTFLSTRPTDENAADAQESQQPDDVQ